MKRTTSDFGVSVLLTKPKLAGVFATAVCLSAWSFAPRAAASIYTLAPGGNIAALSSDYPTGGTVLDTVTDPFTSSTIDGTIISQVISGDPSNPYGGLTFTYLVEDNAVATDSVSEMTVGSYGGFLTDVSYNATGSEVLPSNFTRSATGSGSTIRFLWSSGGGIQPDQTGALIVVQTSAQNYAPAQGGVIDSQTVNISTLAPVPEPGTVSLLIAGLGLFFFSRRNSK